MFRALEPWHLIILVLVVVLLFGGRRLPDAARGLGRSLRIFKSEVKQMQDESPRPATRPTEPIEGPYEGRIVDEQRRTSTPGDAPRDL
jgi:sec-independent protein translocase protein TatA